MKYCGLLFREEGTNAEHKWKIAFRGIAIGKIKEISKETNVVRRVKINDVQAEIERFEAARDQAAQELKELYDKAVKEVGEANAAIFEVHQMML